MKSPPIYLVRRIDFDSLENDASNARSMSILGYFNDAKAADQFCANERKTAVAQRGWDGDTYPKFESIRVNAICPPSTMSTRKRDRG